MARGHGSPVPANEDSESSDDDRILQIRSRRRLQARDAAPEAASLDAGLSTPRTTPGVEDDIAGAAERAFVWMTKAGRLRTPSHDDYGEGHDSA